VHFPRIINASFQWRCRGLERPATSREKVIIPDRKLHRFPRTDQENAVDLLRHLDPCVSPAQEHARKTITGRRIT
jgi:hypothetical protein